MKSRKIDNVFLMDPSTYMTWCQCVIAGKFPASFSSQRSKCVTQPHHTTNRRPTITLNWKYLFYPISLICNVRKYDVCAIQNKYWKCENNSIDLSQIITTKVEIMADMMDTGKEEEMFEVLKIHWIYLDLEKSKNTMWLFIEGFH